MLAAAQQQRVGSGPLETSGCSPRMHIFALPTTLRAVSSPTVGPTNFSWFVRLHSSDRALAGQSSREKSGPRWLFASARFSNLASARSTALCTRRADSTMAGYCEHVLRSTCAFDRLTVV